MTRGIHATWEVGFEDPGLSARAIHVDWNTSIEPLSVLARAIHGTWRVYLSLGPLSEIEWVLYDTDFITLERILRGK